jgi:hypothetical protein
MPLLRSKYDQSMVTHDCQKLHTIILIFILWISVTDMIQAYWSFLKFTLILLFNTFSCHENKFAIFSWSFMLSILHSKYTLYFKGRTAVKWVTKMGITQFAHIGYSQNCSQRCSRCLPASVVIFQDCQLLRFNKISRFQCDRGLSVQCLQALSGALMHAWHHSTLKTRIGIPWIYQQSCYNAGKPLTYSFLLLCCKLIFLCW